MDLETPLETICRIIIRARELDAQVPAADPDEVDDDTEKNDDQYDVLIDEKNDSIEEEIETILSDLAEDQLAEMLALTWVGSGTFETGEWAEAIEEASDAGSDAVIQLMDMPMLAAYLDAGIAAFDLSCDGIGQID
ncbi:MAG: DUF3775 domain-containing protein [Sphingomonadaceae bacterium]|nr:DUF3775 domain-containing protein [Sphingomonadaceae bacterium]